MRYIADLHIHSCYSRATSKASRLPGLAAWAAIKGIRVLATGDFTHPGWLQHLTENLEPAEPGFFKLRSWENDEIATYLPAGINPSDLALADIRFVLSSEISSIYKKDGKVRKIHNIVYAPDFDSVRRINKKLAGIGNLESDGRPILGLDAHDLLAIARDAAPGGFFVPAHIWTPWFSLFGSKSGFDAIEECFGDLIEEIFALETGLSSDPDMNRCISALDRFTLISNSDCHSPAKLGREANIFSTELSFDALKQALRNPVTREGEKVFTGTIEFYPEEGKYHCDGHRKCRVCLEPDETMRNKGKCPVCGRPVTVGVLHRVMDLADRSAPVYGKDAPAVFSLIPLPEVLSELLGVGPASKTVMRSYVHAINTFSSEFNLLLDVPIGDIAAQGSALLAEAVSRMRQGRVIRRPGYDGEFGVIRVFDEDELSRLAGQLELFGAQVRTRKRKPKKNSISPQARKAPKKKGAVALKNKLNRRQQAVVTSSSNHILVQAGPGTGKTHTLVARLCRQMDRTSDPATVFTFTNKAAVEIRERVQGAPGISQQSVFIATLHGFCLHFLRKQDPTLQVVGPEMRMLFLRKLFPDQPGSALVTLSSQLSKLFANPGSLHAVSPETVQWARKYSEMVDSRHYIDLEAIIPCALAMLKKDSPHAEAMRRQTACLYIDEFQDLNALQYQLVLELARSSSIFAIGDPDQAIYGFRGADPRWFFAFIEDLHPEVHTLDINYRSDASIVAAASQVIAANATGNRKIIAHSSRPGRICIEQCRSDRDEADFIVRMIERLVGGTSHREIEQLTAEEQDIFSLADIGVLYRTGRQADIIGDALFNQGIPFRRIGLTPFYLDEPVKPLYLWALAAADLALPADHLALLAREPGIGKKTLQRVEETIFSSQNPLMDFLQLAEKTERLKRAGTRWKELRDNIHTVSKKKGVAAGLATVLTYYWISDNTPEIRRFFRLAGSFGTTLAEFAQYLQENSLSPAAEPPGEAVTLMTLHAAKGVEFPVVFLSGLEEGILPLQPREQLSRAAFNAHIEEERRLFFVGLTRARHQLYLSRSTAEHRNGRPGYGRPSRFIRDIDPVLLTKPPQRRKQTRKYKQLSLFSLP
ncbi:MAG TPA: DNA helicase II [Desulfobulbus sp.]|nr:DNA helicase II [Desulfobulbus sp.]